MSLDLVRKLPYNHPYRYDGTKFGGSKLFTPSDITKALWLDAYDEDTITDSLGKVSAWNDKSGNLNHALQGTEINQPITNVNSLGGLNVVKFSQDYMSFASDITGIKSAIWVSNNLLGGSVSAGASRIFGDNIQFSSGSHYTFIATDATLAYDISIDGSTDNTGNASVNGGSLVSGGNIDLGRTFEENKAENVWYSDYDNAIFISYLGAGYEPVTEFLKGDIAEVILLTTVPSTEERQKIEGYLAHKWALEDNLPEGHPYKTDAPTV